MRFGLLWWCGDKYVLAEQVGKACRRYLEKYGRVANLVYVNPATLGEWKNAGGSVEFKPARSILPHHLWVGEKSQ